MNKPSIFSGAYGVACAVAAFTLAACASPGVPPGGPVDTEAPKVVRIVPDSGATGVTPREVIFLFDEVVSERPTGGPSLAAVVQISPREGDPRVSWSRREIAVRPRKGWRPNTAYTITLLPGLSDLRGNTRNTPVVTIFSTGTTIPSGRIAGTLFNWGEGRIIPRGIIEARNLPDTTTPYVASSDSIGDFVIGNLPPGTYNVRGYSDDNTNRGLDPLEPWDSVGITLADTARVELLAFVHDTIGSRLGTVSVRDSVTLELVFDNPLSVSRPLAPANVRVRAPDSTDVPVLSVTPPAPDTAVGRAAPARAGAVPIPGAVTPPARAVRRPSRPPPPRTMIVRLGRPLRPRTDYRIRVTDAVNLMGKARTSERVITVPVPAAPTPAPAAAPAAPPAPIRR